MKIHYILLSGASALAISWGAGPAFAAGAAAAATSADATTSVDTVIVTARRQAENLQDVPVSVEVVTGKTLQDMSINRASELSKLAPGLQISEQGGASQQIVLRGVAWQPGSGTPATPTYVNEIPFDPQRTIRSIFDLEQIEVLKGPQGTTRGAPSISGAITMTTHRPSLSEFGGYVQGSYGEGDHGDFQGAVDVPIIKDVLAIRAAVNIEHSEGSRVDSVHSSVKPEVLSNTYRLTALFKPTDDLTFEAMYQRVRDKGEGYPQVVGAGSPGSPGGVIGGQFAPPIAANFNGPAITEGQRLSVSDKPNVFYDYVDLIGLNGNWKVLGQVLTYNYGRQLDTSPTNFLPTDALNFLPGFEPYNLQTNVGHPFFQTQELRLASAPGTYKYFDYDLGYFEKKSHGVINFVSPTFLSGAFGRPNSAIPGSVTSPNSAYILGSSTNIFIGQSFHSFYGNLQLHLWGTELSGGLAQVHDQVPVQLNVRTFPALNAVVSPQLPLAAFCPFAGNVVTPAAASTNYPGAPQVCDVSLPAGIGNSNLTYNNTYQHTLYNFTASHKFFDDRVLAYATTGSSFRTGLPAINNTGLPGGLTNPKPEYAKSYEVGVKTTWSPRLRVNADVFEIDYQNQLTTFQGVNYFNSSTGRVSTTSIAFYGNVNSKIQGFEVEVAARPVDRLSLAVNLSYAPIKSQGGNVPCNVGPAITATNPINFCASSKGQNLSQAAPFQVTFNGDYTVPLGSLEAYFRYNVNYQGRNPNFGNDPIAGSFKSTPSYALVDLFAGVNKIEGKKGWDLGVYAKNVFNKNVELNRFTPLNNIYAPFAGAPGGYDAVTTSLPREAGVKLNYMF